MREQVTFLELCRDVDRAVEVSLQPIDAIGSEAVIFFSDIFTPIPGMGVEVDFRPGPVVAQPIRSAAQVAALRAPDPRESVGGLFPERQHPRRQQGELVEERPEGRHQGVRSVRGGPPGAPGSGCIRARRRRTSRTASSVMK